MGKFHSKTAEEADALLSQSLPSTRRAIKPIKDSTKTALPLPTTTSIGSEPNKDAQSKKVNIKTDISEQPPAKKQKVTAVKPVKQSAKSVPIEPKAKIEADDSDPDKISCPICTKLWHKSNLRYVSLPLVVLEGTI